jgi:hypothetical protein
MLQNQDLDSNNFFIKKDCTELITNIADLKFKPLSREVYFRPSACPIIDINNSNNGSCFEDYTIPTASYQFNIGNNIKCVPVEKNLSPTAYTDTLYQSIFSQIKKIYQTHPTVTIAYSGGIDSMVLLSFIEQQGFLARTHLVCFTNITQQSNTCLHRNPTKQIKLNAVLDQLKDQVKSITQLTIDLKDIAHAFNHGQLEQLKCYTTHSILNQIDSPAFIFGTHGNQVLLHKNIFVDEILLHRSTGYQELCNLLSGPLDFYTQSLVDYDVDSPSLGIEHRYLVLKPWHLLSSSGKLIYSPLADSATFEQLRRLDFSKIPVGTIAHATVAREFITQNNCEWLTKYIDVEGVKDYDNLEDAVIPIELLHTDLLAIPANLNHNAEGLEYLQNEITKAHQNANIPINSLVAIKALQWIADK